MAKKYRAQHITVYAVYKKFIFMGNPGRYFKVAFPDLKDAEKWVEQDGYAEKGDYLIEEMPAIMKAWQP